MNVADTVKPSWGYVGIQVLRRFRGEFQIYFPPALLASVVAYLCIYLLQSVREKLVITPTFESAMDPARFAVPGFLYALGRTSIWTIQSWVVWLVFAFMLASVAMRMLREIHPTEVTIGIGEAFRFVRTRRLAALVGVSGLAGAATAFFSIFLLPLLLRPLPLLLFQLNLLHDYVIAYDWATAALTLLFTALLAKMILAIPELADDQNVSIGQSIRNSIKATVGWEVFFFLEFGIFGLAGVILYFVGKDLLAGSWKHGQLTSTGYELMLAAFTILLAGVALALLAIVHSLLYVSLRYTTAPPLDETPASDVSEMPTPTRPPV
jgi:hypothetical protein